MENIMVKIIIFAINFKYISAQCTTIVTPGGTQTPEKCKFPFRYYGQEFQSCTTFGEKYKLEWCSVQVDNQGNHVKGQGRWGHCDKRLCLNNNTNTVTSSNDQEQCLTISGRFPDKPCIFPFKFKGKTYTECTTDATDDDIPWCSTKVSEDGRHVPEYWGHCPCQNGVCCQSSQDTKNRDGNHNTNSENLRLSKNDSAPNFLPEAPYDCAIFSTHEFVLAAGESASLYEFPYAVMIGYDTPNKVTYTCGGSLINRWYVLSAAHCFRPRFPDAVEVRVGELNFVEDPDCEFNKCAPRVQKIEIDSITVHEGFSETATGIPNDIALVRLATPAQLGPSVMPVCLPVNSDKFSYETQDFDLKKSLVGQPAIVVGWGKISPLDNGEIRELGVFQPHLQKATLLVISTRDCQQDLSPSLGRHSAVNDTFQICAMDRYQDSCKGDSGGPLLLKGKAGERIQIGIVSYGPRHCGSGLPGVYTRVSAYMDWIKNNLKP